MKSYKIQEIVSRVYDSVEIALWAMLLTFVIYFVAFILPKLPEVKAQAERIRIGGVAAENASICEELGTKQGTDTHNQCLLAIGAFRAKVERRVYDENEL